MLEKLDGSNVGVARLNGTLYPLNRSGYMATSSRYAQHHLFAAWVYESQDRFLAVLRDGERLCGEWLAQAHGTRYELRHEPFVAFDLMAGNRRSTFDELVERARLGDFTTPAVLHRGGPLSIDCVIDHLANGVSRSARSSRGRRVAG